MSHSRPFLALWTMAVTATVAAFVLHLALRGRNVQMGYALGKARNEQAGLREVKRVLELEAASYETPQRVEEVARTLLGMQAPSADRVIPVGGLTVTPLAPAAQARSAGAEPPPSASVGVGARNSVASARAEH